MSPEFFVHGKFDKARTVRALSTFRELNNSITSMTSTELYSAYRAELAGKRRESFLSRIEKRLRQITAQRVSAHLHKLQNTHNPQKEQQHEL